MLLFQKSKYIFTITRGFLMAPKKCEKGGHYETD
jgi:hypothetical protein